MFCFPKTYSHVCFVVSTNFLDPDVVLGVYKGLCSAVGLGNSHHTSNVLEITYIVHFDLKHSEIAPHHDQKL